MIVEARRPRPRDDDERFGGDRPQPDRRLPRAARPDREDETLVEDRADDEPIPRDRQAYEPDVDLAPGEPFHLIRRRHVAQLQLNIGMAAAKAQQHLGQQSEDACDAEPDPEATGLSARSALRELEGGFRFPHHLPSPFGEEAARFRQPHVAISPHQQRTANSIFQLPHPLAQRRLRHVQPIRGAAEVQRLGEGDDGFEIHEIDVHSRKLSDGPKCFIGRHRWFRATLGYGRTPVTSIAWPTLTGVAAALCTTLAFVPQLLNMRKGGSAELSSAMLAMYLAGLGLWLVYGVMIGAPPVIAANAISILVVSAVTFRKMTVVPAGGGRQQRLRIAIDMDEVMADALAEHVRRYNAAFGATLAIADLRGRHLEDWIAPARREAVDAMLDASFFANLAVMPGCEEVVRELAARHDVLVVTAAMDVPCSFDAKFRWLQRHFPFIPTSQIVFCGDKGLIDADYLIDDRPRHFERFKGHPLLFSAPHNAAESRYPRVDSWKDVRELFARLDRREGPALHSRGLDQPAAATTGPSIAGAVPVRRHASD